jgi:hypothetical protein
VKKNRKAERVAKAERAALEQAALEAAERNANLPPPRAPRLSPTPSAPWRGKPLN